MMSISCESIAIFVADGAPLADVTTWLYDEASGALTNKVYADGMGPTYDYTPEGRLSRRTWARGIVTDYAYDGWGNLTNTVYSDDTPTISLAYDAMGRMASAVVEGVSTNLYFHSAYGELTNEVQNGVSIARNYDTFSRPTGYALRGSVPPCEVNYSYDALGRFSAVDFNAETQRHRVEYGYLPGTDLVSGYTSGDFSRSVTYEPQRNLIAAVTNVFDSTLISAFVYANDAAGRRVSRVDTFDGATTANTFGYNVRSEVTSAAMGTNTYGYAYDPIGNREWTTLNGVTNTYTANNLNQYTAIDDAAPTYDADGNMTADGSGWHYVWNVENRMVCASNDEVVVTYAYDHRGRMVKKGIVRSNGDLQSIAYLWDDWNIIRETLATPASTLVTSNVWGLDLDGSLQGAGGVGGLLSVVRGGEAFLPTYDANGNVCEYVGASNGGISAHYVYSPFGEPLAATSELTTSFLHLFSTKPYCYASYKIEYQQRQYRHDFGRWTSRDPIHDVSFTVGSLYFTPLFQPSDTVPFGYLEGEYIDNATPSYSFCGNSSQSQYDLFGLSNNWAHHGRCCNRSKRDEWALVSEGEDPDTKCGWMKLSPGECVGGFLSSIDCEGMTCGKGFYFVKPYDITGICITPGCDHWPYTNRRWTPDSKNRDPGGLSPLGLCEGCADTPPGYGYGPRAQ